MAIRDKDLRWILEAVLQTQQPEFAEHRGFARALLSTMGRTRGRKPGQTAAKPKPKPKRR